VVFLEEELRLLGEGRPVARAVFLEDLDLPSEQPAGLVDLLDGQSFGLDRARFADRHGPRRAVELAHRDLFLRDGHAAASGHRGRLRFTDSAAGLAVATGQKSRRGQRHGESGLDGT
jgi:hypothetical protein